MRIRRVRVQGFRCLEDVEIALDDVTTLIGPNGVGKSSVLRALDWFFNGSAGDIADADVAPSAEGRVRVEVEFCDLTARDREELGRYAPTGAAAVRLWKTWEGGSEVFSGNARSLAEFGPVRAAASAADKKDLYKNLREQRGDLNLPVANTAVAIEQAMVAWEADHPEQLADSEERCTTKFFGFLGGAKLSGLFDFVFVSADLRASEEAVDARNATIGKLLERTIDRAPVAQEIDGLITELNQKQVQLVDDHLGDELVALSTDLTTKVGRYTAGRRVDLDAAPAAIKAPGLQFQTSVTDGVVHTSVAGQGHGFQRALLVAALQLVAEKGRQDGADGTVFLAIEEPELYQHPAQARSFAATLRTLAEDPAQSVQVLYATHSPLFIEPGRFDQLRRMRRVEGAPEDPPSAQVVAGDRAHVVAALEGLMNADQVGKQIDKTCPQQLAEAVFADAVLLVEGETDKAIYDALVRRNPDALARNVAVIEASGKDSLPLCRAVLGSLEISAVVVADTDSNRRIADEGAASEKDREREQHAKRSNRRLLSTFGLPAADWPADGFQGDDDLVFIDPRLEDWLPAAWPEWETRRAELVADGSGHGGKHALTYFNAALDAANPPDALVETVVRLATRAQ